MSDPISWLEKGTEEHFALGSTTQKDELSGPCNLMEVLGMNSLFAQPNNLSSKLAQGSRDWRCPTAQQSWYLSNPLGQATFPGLGEQIKLPLKQASLSWCYPIIEPWVTPVLTTGMRHWTGDQFAPTCRKCWQCTT